MLSVVFYGVFFNKYFSLIDILPIFLFDQITIILIIRNPISLDVHRYTSIQGYRDAYFLFSFLDTISLFEIDENDISGQEFLES